MLCGIVGKMGGGKTLTMTYMLLQDFAAGRRIYTNYRLKFPKRRDGYITETIQMEWLLDSKNENLNNCSVGIDEFWLFADARNSASGQNKAISHILLQSRKRNVDIYVTAQTYMQLDKRFRQNADYIMYCKKRGDYIYFTMINREDPNKVRNYRLDGRPIFEMYDTNEIINPLLKAEEDG